MPTGHVKSLRLLVACLVLGACLIATFASPAIDNEPVILVLGDSLSAEYGLSAGQGWVHLLQRRLRTEGYSYRVVNASVSGETTRGGLARLQQALQTHRPSIVIVELGGNDGLRGLRPKEVRKNLDAIVVQADQAGARVMLLGVRMPPNYGPAYARRFQGVFEEVASARAVPLVARFLGGVAENPALMQNDGIHPTAQAQPLMLDNAWPQLRTLLE